MKIGILGAGAIGCILGAFLQEAGADVCLVSRNKKNMNEIAQNGLELEINGESTTIQIKASSNPEAVGVCDLVLIVTKSPDTRGALESAKKMSDEHTYILSLQNGVGTADIIMEEFPAELVGYGILKTGGTMVRPGRVVGKGIVKDGTAVQFASCIPGNRPEQFAEFEQLLCSGELLGIRLGAQLTDVAQIDQLKWEKLANNVVDNMLIAICQTPLKAMGKVPESFELRKGLVLELKIVAESKGIRFDFDRFWDTYINFAIPMLGEMFPSCAYDFYYKKHTEIDFINGAISRYGKELGIPTPLNDAITAIVKIIENTYEYEITLDAAFKH